MRIHCTNTRQSLGANLEFAVKITARLVPGKAASKLSAAFYRSPAYSAGFLRQPCCRHRKGWCSLCCATVEPHTSLLPSPRPRKSQLQCRKWALARGRLALNCTHVFIWRGKDLCLIQLGFEARIHVLHCSPTEISLWGNSGRTWTVPSPVPAAKSTGESSTPLLGKRLVWDAWERRFQLFVFVHKVSGTGKGNESLYGLCARN